ncbi:SDR family NAD(P)-dependent oxidoreductase [Yinghuangia sp. ASG 101]|uniref:SDR family NAD(P)-dependent oxidoreductase n=1 Tax=Yinghuangia sp. ASG 101 TaxID=2896848 RepID=UPI001E650107|nr:SDR family NAD(P)-dependent oxidoreductase [Yinghuangia sp. ASG 101]UGQ13140.1 SDR family NAD(P)-dependent oxidoreductase [Yinghuangia sp. ASG 101]
MPIFGPETTAEEAVAGADLTGRVVVVTGATSGLGAETVRVLAGAGAHVVATARDAGKAAETVDSLAGEGRSVEAGVLDLGSAASVREFAAWLLARHPRVDVLVNNAGVMATPLGRTADGFETQFGTNHLGHFLLTNLLVPALLRGAPARVVNLSSAGHKVSDILWDDPNFATTEYQPWVAYGQSKTANVLFAVELDRRLADRGVRAYAVHPGSVGTNLGRYLGKEEGAAMLARATSSAHRAKSVPEGAATQVWAATSPDLAGRGGLYLEDCHVSDNHRPWARDPEAAARLWAMSEELLGEKFPAV